MKRLFTLLAICVATTMLVGCGGNEYETRARKWICDHVDHYVCLDAERHALYSFFEKTTNGNYFVKLDLDTMEESEIWVLNGVDNVSYGLTYGVEGYILPEDKGYSNENSTFVVVGRDDKLPSNERYSAHIFDTFTERTTKICQGAKVLVHGNIISCCTATKGYNAAITNVDVYDAEGKKLEPKRYQGTIAGQGVMVELVEKDGNLAGSYYYTKYGPNNRIYIFGEMDEENHLDIEGLNANGVNCEDWAGRLENGVITAEFYNNYNGRTYNFTLTQVM